MLSTILLILLSILPGVKQENKKYHSNYRGEIQDIYDFESDGLYYEFAGENEVNLVRKKTLLVSLDYEMPALENAYQGAYYYNEDNICYTGDIVIPDSVEHNGKKYRVAAYNNCALSFSRGLKSVTFKSDISFFIGPLLEAYDSSIRPLFYNQHLESVTFADDQTSINDVLCRASALKSIHFPYKLTEIYNSFNDTGISEVDLDNHGEYNPSTFTIRNCFMNSPNLKKVKYPECDTLYFMGGDFLDCFNVESIVFRPCKVIDGRYDLIFYRLHYQLDYPLKVVSEGVTPPELFDFHPEDAEDLNCAILYVPEEAIDDYKAAIGWQNFGDIRPLSEYLAEEEAAIDGPVVDVKNVAKVDLASNGTELNLSVSAPTDLTVWSLQGQAVWSGYVTDEVTVALPHDVYIITTPTSTRKYRH